MRQLVSVVTDQTVSYFVASDDSDHVHQVAQVMNTGLAVSEVVDLGANLLAALKLNGTKPRKLDRPKPQQPAAAALPAAQPARPAKRAPRKMPAERVNWGLSMADVLADIRAHPGTTYPEITQRLTGSDDPRAKGSVTAHVGALVNKHHQLIRVEYESKQLTGSTGRRTGVKIARLTYLGGPEPEPEPEQQ